MTTGDIFDSRARQTPPAWTGRSRLGAYATFPPATINARIQKPMKMLLFGASGLVGGALARMGGEAGHSILGTVGSWPGSAIPGLAEQVKADLMDPAAVDHVVTSSGAAVIVNAAAVSEPGACDADPGRSHRLNVELPAQLAGLAEKSGARLIHLSSEQVFDGTTPPYSAGDPVHGINLYARQKIEAEARVQAICASALTLRLPLLLGNSLSRRRSVHERLLELWSAGGAAKLYVDEFRQCCTAGSVARAILEIIDRPGLAGVLHWAGAEPLSRFEIGERIRRRFGLTERQAPIVAVERKDDPRALASRPANLSMNLEPLTTLLPTKPQTADAAFAELEPPPWWQAG